MRTLSIAITAGAVLAGPVAAQTARSDIQTLRTAKPDRCAPTAGIVDYRRQRPPSMKLGDQPPASQIYTVYNVIDRCPQPVVLRKGIGANPQNAAPALRVPPRTTQTQAR